MSLVSDILSNITEENLTNALERYRDFGPLPGIALTFMKSFVPPLPTILIVGVNAAVYGLWLGFLYSLDRDRRGVSHDIPRGAQNRGTPLLR